MKTIRYISILVLFTISSFCAKAQMAGYMGKTFEVSYTNLIFPNYGIPYPELSVHSFRLEKVISRRSAFLLKFDILPQQMDEDDINKRKQLYDDVNLYKEVGNRKLSIQTTVFSLHHVLYTHGWVAPVGSYFSYGISLANINYNNFDIEVEPYIDDGYVQVKFKDIKAAPETIRKVYVDLSFGRKWMLFNRISLRAEIGGRLNMKTLNESYYSMSETTFFDKQEYKKEVQHRVSVGLLFNAGIGIGVLLF
jgi:hypothetical protein